jgi:hypothetical protein
MSIEIYPGGDHQFSINLGLALWGTDEVTTDNFLLIDAAFGSINTSIKVNGSVVNNPNFVNSASVVFNVVGSNISLTSSGGGGTFPVSFPAVAHEWLNSYNALTGVFTATQPSYSDISGSPPASAANVVLKTSNYNAVANDFVECDTSGGGFTVTLPLSAANGGKTITVKKISNDTNVLTIACSGADSIDSQPTQTTAIPNTAVENMADGFASWRIY